MPRLPTNATITVYEKSRQQGKYTLADEKKSERQQERTIIKTLMYPNNSSFLAGEEGFEPSAYGFGDRRSTS